MKKVKNKNIPNYDNVKKALKSAENKTFGLEFIKRGDGTLRKMSARLNVKKHLHGGELQYSPKNNNLIIVFSMEDNGYRAIPVENIKKIVLDKKVYTF